MALTMHAPGGAILREIIIAERGGDDTLLGGQGADTLVGGEGADSFEYRTAAEGGDSIRDFAPGDDRITVSAAGFGGGLEASGRLDPGRFTANATGLSDADCGIGQFVYRTTDGSLWWDADGTATAEAVLIARLDGLPALGAADVFVIA
ncbi:M10 family metallopeptidase C-terminal domain-containing protein [Siccirubricoccus deserti]